LEVVHSAARAGAAVANHAPVTGFLENASGRVVGARFRNEDPAAEPGEYQVTADSVVSAAGVYTDLLLGLAGREQPVLRPSKGIHLVFRSEATGGKALVLPVGGNVLYFLVPFRPGYLAVGCTDTDYPADSYGRLDRVPTTEEEVHFTLGLLERVMPGVFGPDQVLACYAGVRPLLAPPGNRSLSESATSRTHRIWQAHGGIWAVAGGKYTTFRLMAEQLVDRVAEDLRSRSPGLRLAPCATARQAYHGAPKEGFQAWSGREAERLALLAGLPADCCRHLCCAYGTAAAEVAALVQEDAALGGRIASGRPFVRAEIRYAAEREMCRSAADFLVRRTQLRFLEHQGLDALEAVVEGLGDRLGWSAELRRRQAADYRDYLRQVTPSFR
ncbi:MAG TPA: FAD-dependent oxidoreductase, partial [Anaerolineales bacterium]|nr:FAD-dependent oxidoreductase [Anaerolineales bacterium]